jgi:hypothetical protein
VNNICDARLHAALLTQAACGHSAADGLTNIAHHANRDIVKE